MVQIRQGVAEYDLPGDEEQACFERALETTRGGGRSRESHSYALPALAVDSSETQRHREDTAQGETSMQTRAYREDHAPDFRTDHLEIECDEAIHIVLGKVLRPSNIRTCV